MEDIESLSERNRNEIVRVTIYTDGACDPNPGPGGWGAVVELGDREELLSGGAHNTTNNRMELTATTEALGWLVRSFGPCNVDLYTDSQYLRLGITQWIKAWVARGWRTKGNKPVKNQDLWSRLAELDAAHSVSWHWVKGHAGHRQNELADKLARDGRRRLLRQRKTEDTMRQEELGRAIVAICVKVSCLPGGQCGWGAVLRQGDHTRSLSGTEEATTANAMLLEAAANALVSLKLPCRVVLYSGASYLIRGASQWVKGWQTRGWKTKDGKPVANQAMWRNLVHAASRHEVTWVIAKDGVNPQDLDSAGAIAAQAARGRKT